MRKLLEEVMGLDQEEAASEPVVQGLPEVTPELMASLVEQMPELADIDQVELEKGIKVELEHYDTVGGDMLLVAKIAVDHINETPEGKSYYDALAQMEHELQETPEEEEEEHLEGEEEELEAPVEEPEEEVLVGEGKEERGVRDGTGPYKDSAQKGEGMRKKAGEKCPFEDASEDDSNN